MSESVLRYVVLPATFNKNGTKFVDFEFDNKYEAQDHFQSCVFFITASVVLEKDIVKIPLVVKFQPKEETTRTHFNTGVQFYNEVFMYSEFLPFISKNNICEDTFPVLYHGLGTLEDPEKDVIVIGDLRQKGYRLTDEKGFIDVQHLELAMEKLGRFHALSYVAKKENPEGFYKMVGKLKEPKWVDSKLDWADTTIQRCFHRAMDPLVSSGRHAAVLRRLLARVDEPGGVYRLMKDLVAAEEPVAVLCHGDFCRNNMLFRYTSQAPVDVKFFDLATSRYATPAVDICFFLLMNSSPAVRATHWDGLLARYHAALSETAHIHGAAVPSLQRLQQEVKRKAVYGFFHASFFLPMMLWGDSDSKQDMTPEEMADYPCTLGGEEGTQLLVNMIAELVERGCLTLDHTFLKDVGGG